MMRRFLSLFAVAGLCAALGAQGTPSITKAQQGELFKKNRLVIEKLVDKTVEASHTPNDHLKRADTYYAVLVEFSKEMRAARDSNDKERIDELTSHLTKLLDDGLAPTLNDARRQVENGTHSENFVVVRDQLLAQVGALMDDMGEQSPARKSLEETRGKLKSIVGPKK